MPPVPASASCEAVPLFPPPNGRELEEPLIPDDVNRLARVAVEGRLPIAAGENLHTVYEFEETITRGRVSFPEPDAATLGGITPWLRVARLAEARNLLVTSHGIHDIHVHLLGAVTAGRAQRAFLVRLAQWGVTDRSAEGSSP